MIKDIREINFPEYATLDQATASISDMGDRTISAQVKIDGSIVPDFSFDWEVEFKGERYIHPVREPQGLKDNTSRKSKIDMTFYHWAIYEMKREFFMEMASTTAGTAVADKYIASLGLNLGDFVAAFNLVLNHYFGGKIVMKLNPDWQYATEASLMSISYSYVWDVLQQIHEIYGVRWTLKTNAEGVCEILAGYPAEEVSHIFEYGFEGGLLSVQRQVQSTNIRNRLLGRGGEKNLPYRYFKDADPNNPLFKADPDWVPELANIAFTELRGKTFRDYVKGWKAKHYNGSVMDQPTEAYLAGYNASKFDPTEYVEDKDSIEKYGVLVGALQNNEDIYPSIQGAPNDVDAIVDAEQVTDDDVDSAVENDSVTTNLESGYQTYRNAPANSTVTIETLTKRYFSVPEGKVGNLSMSLTATGKYSNFGDYEETHPILKADTVKVTIHDKITGAEVKSSSVPVVDIPAGDYYYMISADVETNYDRTSMVTLNIESVYLYTSTPNKSEGWKQTFDIWVRNIWGSTRSDGETDQQYADRVWVPILGDRMGGDARVVFASGWLSFSSDWEFPIVGYAFDNSKSGAEWRLTLAKSEAELEASGKYIPYEGYNASGGDRFFFIGIDMPYEYVTWAEERLDDYKRDALLQTANINPTWVIKTDKVRLNQERTNDKDEKVRLIDSLNIGSQIRLASKQFIAGAYETLYVQSMTYSWQADTLLHPDIEIVVSDKVASVKNPVAQIQSNIESIQKQVGSLSNIQQIIRQVCDKLYLRKDGFSDISKSPTRFLGKISGENFRPGQIGGRDWGIYRDENGNAILEADKFVARQGILVNELIVSEATYVGGLQINSAASMNITVVEETEDGYVCFFDQKQGSVTNKFVVDDVVLCQRFDADQTVVKFYKARVTAVSEDSVTLSKTEVNGTGIPAVDDAIIQYGNYSDKTRQYVIVRDVIGGGYERMLMGLDSVESDGVEYYFAGKSADSTARWFVGGTEQFAEYKDGQLTIKGNIFVTGSDKNVSEQLAQIDFIREAFGENAQGLVLGTAIIVGYTDENDKFVPMAGLSGVYDKEAENGGPAAWYGGTPDDAKSVIFMDGTGYFADGLFRWDKDKGVNLGNGAIKINYDGSVEFGGDIKIGGTGEETLDSLLTAVATLFDIWKIDEETGNLITERNVVIKKNLTVYEDMSSGSDGDPSTNTGLNKEELQEYLDENNYVTETRVQEMIDEVTAGDVELTNYYTKKEVDDLVGPIRKDVEDIATVLGIDEEAEGYINTWAEVKAFLDGYQNSDDLAVILSGINAEVAKNATAILGLDERLKVEEGVTETYGQWWADLKKHILVNAEDDVTIDTDLIVSGDVASGDDGQGTAASGTVTGVKVGNDTYAEDYITAGILDLTDAFNRIDVSDQLADYLPKSGGTIKRNNVRNPLAIDTSDSTGAYLVFRANGGDTSFVGYDSSLGALLQNALTNTRLYVGEHAAYLDWSGSAVYTIFHSGNANKSDVPWAVSKILFPQGTSATWNIHQTGSYEGITVLNTVGAPSEGAPNEYAVGLSVSGYYGFCLAHYGGGQGAYWLKGSGEDAWKAIAFTDSNITGNAAGLKYPGGGVRASALSDGGVRFSHYITFGESSNLICRGSQFSTSLSDNTLLYSAESHHFVTNNKNAMLINSSGNITIGDQDLAETSAKLYVDGNVELNSGEIDKVSSISHYDSKTGYFVGRRNAGLGVTTGGLLLLSYGATPMSFYTNTTERMRITETGNVLIGDTEDKGGKLQVSGNSLISGDLVVSGDIASGGNGESTDAVGTITGIKVNGQTYDNPVAGILTIPDYPTSLTWSAIDGKPTKLSEFTDDILSGKYLSLSGGTVDGNLQLGKEQGEATQYFFRIWRKIDNQRNRFLACILDSKDYEISYYNQDSQTYARLVVGTSGYKIGGQTLYDIIHSNNIKDYALKLDGSNSMGASAFITWATGEGAEDYSVYGEGIRLLGYNARTNNYMGGIHVGTRYGWQLVRDGYGNKMKVRMRKVETNTWLDEWHTIAFTTDNVASATKLLDDTAFTIWGKTFFENGKPKNVDGDITIHGAVVGLNASDAYESFVGNASGGISNGDGALMYAYGERSLYFYTNYTLRMLINSSGNVLIGTSTDDGSGDKLQVNGGINCIATSKIYERNTKTRLTHYTYNGIGRIYVYDETNDADKDLWLGSSGALVVKGNGAVTMLSTLSVSGKTTISNDLVVSGDVASGGGGESTDAVGTITGIKVGSDTYADDYISSGVLDLTDAFNKIDVSDQLANYLPLGGGSLNKTAYISWGAASANGNDISDWNLTGFGLRILSAGGGSTGVPTTYATALHVRGRYGFQIASAGGNGDYFYMRNISTIRDWVQLIHSGNIGSQSVSYASSAGNAGDADTLDENHLMTQVSDWNGMQLSIFKSSENKATNAPSTDFTYGVQLRFHRDSNKYFTDIATSLYNDKLYYRRHDENGFGSWKTIAFTDSNITGNAATATKATQDGNGNVITSTYLPLSGGYMTGNLYLGSEGSTTAQLLFQMWRTIDSQKNRILMTVLDSKDYELSYYNPTVGTYARLVVGTSGYKIGGHTLYDIIHSGNIGSHKAGDSALLDGSHKFEFYRRNMDSIPTSGDIAALETGCYWVYENLGQTNPAPSTYASLVAFGKSYYSPQMCVVHNASKAWLRGIYNTSTGFSASDWHELAFKDSNVASAQALTHSNGTLCASVTSTGSLDFNHHEINNITNINCYDSGTGFYIGGRNYGLGVDTGGALIYSYGNTPISFYAKGSERMRIAGDGTITINGNTNINGKTTVSSDLVVTGDVATGGSGGGSSTTESNCLGPVELDMQSISGLGTFTKAQMDSLGLTSEVLSNMFAGLYTKVIDRNGNDVFDYTGYGTLTNCRIFLRQGNGVSTDYTYTLVFNGTTWTVTEN